LKIVGARCIARVYDNAFTINRAAHLNRQRAIHGVASRRFLLTMTMWRKAAAGCNMKGAISGVCTVAAVAQAAIPSAPKAQDVPANPNPVFGPVNPKLFTATTPTVATVNAFLNQQWGYDTARVWQVAAILKTQADGVSKVVVAVGEKGQGSKISQTAFFVLPDGRHAIADTVIPFGAKPFEDARAILADRAAGPSHGAKSKELNIVEFADLECPHCKEAQPSMNQLLTDFPQAHIVFENYPLTSIHPYAFEAAAEGVCVRKEKGDDAFFTYTNAVFERQAALTPESVAQTLATAAAKAGADPQTAAACALTPAAKEEVDASTSLAQELGVESTPTLYVNGRPLPVSALPYDVLKKIVIFQAAEDGITLPNQPSLTPLQ
jgi:protein-disulfide isomerase